MNNFSMLLSIRDFSCGLLVMSFLGISFGFDAPHTADIVCDNCHSNSPNSPFYGGAYTGTNGEDTAFNNLCLSCHNGPEGGAPFPRPQAMEVRTHSDRAMTNNASDTWSIDCRKCHNTHY